VKHARSVAQGIRDFRSTVAIALAGLAAGILVAWDVFESDRADAHKSLIAFALPVGWAFIGSGLLVRRREPGNLVGTLMILTGFAWFLRPLTESDSPWVFTAGLVTGALVYPMLVHLLLIYPDGRFRESYAKRFQLVGYASIVVLGLFSSFFWRWPNDRCEQCPDNRLLLLDRPGLGQGLYGFGLLLALVALLVAIVALTRRWHSREGRARRAAAPVLAPGVLTVVAILALVVTSLFSEAASGVAGLVVTVLFVTVPIAFLVGFVRSRLAPAAVGRLLGELERSESARETEAALGNVLGDPTLRLAYWFPAVQGYVDVDGRRFELPDRSTGRMTTRVEYLGTPVAALVYDESLRREPELVQAVAAAARVTLQKDRLETELKAKLEELRLSRARIVEAGDVARQRLERNLHDGAQQRLVTLSLALKLAERELASNPDAAVETLRGAQSELALALEELRELARGLHPAVVADRGLPAAVEGLAARMPVPVETKVELNGRPALATEVAAYYVIAEALANVVKYAEASDVRVEVRRDGDDVVVAVVDDGVGGASPSGGSGLGGLSDRVEALGGSLTIESPSGVGTTLRARIPAR
jgi:signal transduction histidine kinase